MRNRLIMANIRTAKGDVGRLPSCRPLEFGSPFGSSSNVMGTDSSSLSDARCNDQPGPLVSVFSRSLSGRFRLPLIYWIAWMSHLVNK
jgi:hypothetical protein